MDGLHPRIDEIIPIIDEVYWRELGYEAICTSARDSHSAGLHPLGRALDLRTWTSPDSGKQISKLTRKRLSYRLEDAIGPEFQVVTEPDHIHIEFDSG